MKIEWRKVTRFSKIAAAAIFIILPFLYFFAGYKVGMIIGEARTMRQYLHLIELKDSYTR